MLKGAFLKIFYLGGGGGKCQHAVNAVWDVLVGQ